MANMISERFSNSRRAAGEKNRTLPPKAAEIFGFTFLHYF